MKILILDENYPHSENLMGDVFVHVRAKEYAQIHEVLVFSFFSYERELNYEGINVKFFSSQEKLISAIDAYQPDKILIHFYQSWMLNNVIKKFTIPVVIWVHGYEALGWYRRLFNYKLYSPVFFNFIKKNIIQQWEFRKMVNYANKSGLVRFIFVSDWMRKITETDCLKKIKHKDIISNPIDTELFTFKPKSPEHRKKILLLRSFSTRKYANDISVTAIIELSKKSIFKDLTFTIIGSGSLFKKITEPLRQFENIHLQEGAVRHISIPELHQNYGIFLCPTRQDAQGVSMCEAMSSGLIPITSNNTAIPEFVQNNISGLLTSNANEIANAIEYLYINPEKFIKMSTAAAQSIRLKCSIEQIIEKELKIIEE